MTRVSPIIVGLAGIALALLVVAGYLMFRPHQHARTVPAAPAFVDDDGDQAAPAPARAAAPAPAAIPPPSAPAAPEPSPQQVQNAAVKKRALLMADHNQRIIQEAAELAFVVTVESKLLLNFSVMMVPSECFSRDWGPSGAGLLKAAAKAAPANLPPMMKAGRRRPDNAGIATPSESIAHA